MIVHKVIAKKSTVSSHALCNPMNWNHCQPPEQCAISTAGAANWFELKHVSYKWSAWITKDLQPLTAEISSTIFGLAFFKRALKKFASLKNFHFIKGSWKPSCLCYFQHPRNNHNWGEFNTIYALMHQMDKNVRSPLRKYGTTFPVKW